VLFTSQNVRVQAVRQGMFLHSDSGERSSIAAANRHKNTANMILRSYKRYRKFSRLLGLTPLLPTPCTPMRRSLEHMGYMAMDADSSLTIKNRCTRSYRKAYRWSRLTTSKHGSWTSKSSTQIRYTRARHTGSSSRSVHNTLSRCVSLSCPISNHRLPSEPEFFQATANLTP
jgi:hypothetical protein